MSCPICQKDTSDRYRPFCSKRCADVDLGRWMTGSYAISVEEDDEFSEDTTPRTEDTERPH
ncbi:MAG: DNA gyrase inhibitor YacG [Dinoroseobacter sp.]|nr:DNA gyrase inhibitor YacG [Dinoroseobacter sp.]